MATTTEVNDEASRTTTKIVDSSLWWDSFTHLLAELESVSLSSDLPPPLEKKIKENHAWFLDTLSLFKPPNQKSREALDASQLKIGLHHITVETNKKEAALKISSALCLDEVQSYILVHRTINQKSIVADGVFRELHHLVMLQYYLERQCLVKCTRQIIMQALYIVTRSQDASIVDEAQKLISDGLDRKLFSVLQENLSSNFPENMDVDLYTLWAEEVVTEDNLILDVLFLIFYEFCPCTGELWKKLCSLYEGFISNSYNFGKLAVSSEAVASIYHAKLQLLVILIEALDLENLLQMVHDETPFRQGYATFSLSEVQEIDAMVSTFDVFENKESGPLILAWAVFLCLISSLPEKEENNILMEIDHIGYVRQAFEAGSLSSFLEIIENDILRDFDGPIAGFRSVLRTFISAFIASYEFNLQLEDGNLKLILDILCKIYQGEESLCTQFWDRESFVDGPIRCLLCSLEGEFPFRAAELLQLLSALCEGAWPAECVFNFLHKSTGLSSPVEISSCSIVDNASQTVMVVQPLHLPGIEGLVIPSGTCGHLLKMIDRDIALVRWEFSQSGIFVLLLRLAQGLYLEKTSEIIMTLGLLSRLVTFNMGVCSSLLDLGGCMHDEMNSPTEHLRVNVAEIICSWIKSLSPNCSGVALMSMGVNILAKMLKCSPYHVSRLIVQANIFDVAFKKNPFKIGSNGLSSASWLLSGRLAKMLLIDCEQNDCQLTLSVLDLTIQLVDSGMENDVVLALVIFSIQYVLVNHEFWNYKIKHARWKVTLKVLEVLKKCILSVPYIQKLGEVVWDILFGDSSIHNALFRLVCTTSDGLEKLYFSRLYGLTEIEGLQQAIILGMDILSSMLSVLSRDVSSFTVFHQEIMSPTTKPVPVVTAGISLMSFFRNPKLQVGAASLLSRLFIIGDDSRSYALSNVYFGLDDKQIYNFRNTICSILCQEKVENEDLVIATFKMLTSAARYQASFLTAVIALGENPISESCNGDNQPANNDALQCDAANILNSIWIYVKRSDDLVMTKSRIMCNVLNFLKALWQGAAHYTNILKQLRNSDFWKKLLNSVVLSIGKKSCQSESATELDLQNLAYRYQCQHNVLDVVAYEMFLQKKILHSDLVTKESSKSLHNGSDGYKVATSESSCNLKDIFGVWCESSLDAETIKTFVSFEYDDSVKLHARVAASLFAVRVMCKVKGGDRGSLSVSLVDKVTNLWKKLRKLPAFSELMAIYAERGYSGGNELDDLILNDLFYHLQGELEGRQISHIPFKELSQYLLQSNFLQTYHIKHDEDIFPQTDGVRLYDTDRLQGDMAIDLWDLSDWKASKAVAEMLLLSLRNVNFMVSLTASKLSALIALTTTFSISDNNNASFASLENEVKSGRKIPEKSLSSSIDNICQSLHCTIELLPPVSSANEDIVDILAAQAEILFCFTRSPSTCLSLSTCLLILKTSGYGLKVLSNCRPLVTGVICSMKIFLMLILFSLKSSWRDSRFGVQTEIEHNEALPEAANVSLGLLPMLCNCIELTEHCFISMIIIDQILKGFSTPATWFPIIQKHLPMQHIVLKLQDKSSFSNIDIILKFLLTIAHVKEGAEMLLNAGFFASLRVLLDDLSNGRPLSVVERERNLANTNERAQPIWGLSLAVVTTIINSLGESSIFNVEHVVTYFLLEKANLISYYLSAPDFPSDDHDKKRLRALKPHTSLSALRESENTVMLICVLAKHRNAWSRAMKEMESQLRERCIHLLAFISCGTPLHGESSGRVTPIFCHPTLREEYEWHKKPSSINSKNGWFSFSALCCGQNPKYSSFSSRTAIVIKDQPNEHANLTSQTHFSDAMSIQIYRITWLLLKFLCQQAEDAAERAEEVGFVDLAHFPELPMPDILHCLQDQGISVVTELCEANKLKQVTSEIQGVCILMLQITVMALYLEFCVIQICGMRPVHGRVEDFSKEFHALTKATEGRAFLKESINSLKQMVSFVYPELLQAEDVL